MAYEMTLANTWNSNSEITDQEMLWCGGQKYDIGLCVVL